ncbi:hypothetical protein GN244_ATG20299 [Phytophthora infestans]|uniref:Uncharacterized protein n=1 Tax=Phytophthora infestans TaxID=4787 RepID=A0A833W493_PHYIN|nr:hypothetical protein GN244_ATG20299 [Phytophthora infestans]KAF4146079.1 hypothetical protein GN958_ATG04745 [Phytophthora infestans]
MITTLPEPEGRMIMLQSDLEDILDRATGGNNRRGSGGGRSGRGGRSYERPNTLGSSGGRDSARTGTSNGAGGSSGTRGRGRRGGRGGDTINRAAPPFSAPGHTHHSVAARPPGSCLNLKWGSTTHQVRECTQLSSPAEATQLFKAV